MAFRDKFQELVDMHDRKNKDYGTEADPYANVRATEEFGLPAWLGCYVRIADKLKRIQSFAQKGRLENESLRDSLVDIAVYATIALDLYDETNEPVKQDAGPVEISRSEVYKSWSPEQIEEFEQWERDGGGEA